MWLLHKNPNRCKDLLCLLLTLSWMHSYTASFTQSHSLYTVMHKINPFIYIYSLKHRQLFRYYITTSCKAIWHDKCRFFLFYMHKWLYHDTFTDNLHSGTFEFSAFMVKKEELYRGTIEMKCPLNSTLCITLSIKVHIVTHSFLMHVWQCTHFPSRKWKCSHCHWL